MAFLVSLSINAFGDFPTFEDPARFSYGHTSYFQGLSVCKNLHGLFSSFALFLKSFFSSSTHSTAGISLGVGRLWY